MWPYSRSQYQQSMQILQMQKASIKSVLCGHQALCRPVKYSPQMTTWDMQFVLTVKQELSVTTQGPASLTALFLYRFGDWKSTLLGWSQRNRPSLRLQKCQGTGVWCVSPADLVSVCVCERSTIPDTAKLAGMVCLGWWAQHTGRSHFLSRLE